MNGQSQLAAYIGRIGKFDEQETGDFIKVFKEVKVKKRQFIVQPGFTAQHRYFVVKGALRAYVIGKEGEEHTIQLAVEDWWISDYNSYIYQQPATMFVLALEDGVLLQISHDDEWKLKSLSHKYETFFRTLAERSTAFMQRRIIASLTQSAEERYEYFLETYPLLAERMPQYVVASYLGMTTEFLSKIRNKRLPRKGLGKP